MGIKGLHDIIRKYAENVYTPRHLSEYAYKKIAIDISLYLFKYKATFQDRWLSAFIKLISVFRKYDIHCIFIFDGKAPKEKDEERQMRSENREKLENKSSEIEEDINNFNLTGQTTPLLQKVWEEHGGSTNRLLGGKRPFSIRICQEYLEKIKGQIIRITEEDLKMARQLFDILKVPYIKAEGEAETFASYLCVHGLVDAVASEDTDVLVYGTPIFITKINTSDETCVEINHQELIETLDMTSESFMDLCIMCGSDYNSNIRGLGPDKSYKLLIEHKSIEEIENIIDPKTNEPKYNADCLKYIRVRELFTVPKTLSISSIPHCGKPDLVELRKFLWQNRINYNVDSLVLSFQNREMVFEE